MSLDPTFGVVVSFILLWMMYNTETSFMIYIIHTMFIKHQCVLFYNIIVINFFLFARFVNFILYVSMG